MKTLKSLLALTVVALLANWVLAAETVYVTKTGSKYHRESCSSLRASKIPMDLARAAARYGPCKICNPPVPGSATGAAEPPRVTPKEGTSSTKASVRCQAITKKGTQCSRTAKAGSSYCWQHGS